jgi:hypothetical protein
MSRALVHEGHAAPNAGGSRTLGDDEGRRPTRCLDRTGRAFRRTDPNRRARGGGYRQLRPPSRRRCRSRSPLGAGRFFVEYGDEGREPEKRVRLVDERRQVQLGVAACLSAFVEELASTVAVQVHWFPAAQCERPSPPSGPTRHPDARRPAGTNGRRYAPARPWPSFDLRKVRREVDLPVPTPGEGRPPPRCRSPARAWPAQPGWLRPVRARVLIGSLPGGASRSLLRRVHAPTLGQRLQRGHLQVEEGRPRERSRPRSITCARGRVAADLPTAVVREEAPRPAALPWAVEEEGAEEEEEAVRAVGRILAVEAGGTTGDCDSALPSRCRPRTSPPGLRSVARNS